MLDELRGQVQEGDDVQTALDPEAQQTAVDALDGQNGSVVALDPSTGEVLTMVSLPAYDPNDVPERFKELNENDEAPLFNRATQAGYPPGSTMKVVTATAALDSGEFDHGHDPERRQPRRHLRRPAGELRRADFGDDRHGDGPDQLRQHVLGPDRRGHRHRHDVRVHGPVRVQLRRRPWTTRRFQLATSGEFGENGELLEAGSDQIDVGRMAIGQDKLNVTPLQMAMVASAVANGGELMEPRLWSKVIDTDGREEKLDPERMSRVMSEDTAETLTGMMTDVVNEGTATAPPRSARSRWRARREPRRSTPSADLNQAWFIGFAPADEPEVAIAATIERTGGQGGTVAAPIAQQVMEVLLANNASDDDE